MNDEQRRALEALDYALEAATRAEALDLLQAETQAPESINDVCGSVRRALKRRRAVSEVRIYGVEGGTLSLGLSLSGDVVYLDHNPGESKKSHPCHFDYDVDRLDGGTS